MVNEIYVIETAVLTFMSLLPTCLYIILTGRHDEQGAPPRMVNTFLTVAENSPVAYLLCVESSNDDFFLTSTCTAASGTERH